MRGLLMLMLVLGLIACEQEASNSEGSIEELKEDGGFSNASIIRNRVSAENIDTVNVAKLKFEQSVFNFGEITEGEVVEYEYKFTNVGKEPLKISDVKTTCGCTVPDYPKKPILPSESSKIRVKFNSNNKEGFMNKPITIIANTYPGDTKVYLKGTVIKK